MRVPRNDKFIIVIAELDPAIHPFKKKDARVKPAHDELEFRSKK